MATTACSRSHKAGYFHTGNPFACLRFAMVCVVRFNTAKLGRITMMAILHFTTLVITTLFAAGAAALVNWLLLRAAFQLMRPATAGRTPTRNATGALLRRARVSS